MKRIISLIISVILAISMGLAAQARLIGDIDGNGTVNSSDALLILQYSVGQKEPAIKTIADVNGDGAINSADALIALQISVGSYTGPTEADDILITSYKRDLVDPITSSGKFTIKATAYSGSRTIPMTIEYRDGNLAVTINELTEIRILIMDGKSYITIPKRRIYTQASDKEFGAEFSIVSGDESKYTGSEEINRNGVTYICEHYKSSDGAEKDYYFRNGKLAMIVDPTSGDDETVLMITDIYAGVEDSSFSLAGYIKL